MLRVLGAGPGRRQQHSGTPGAQSGGGRRSGEGGQTSDVPCCHGALLKTFCGGDGMNGSRARSMSDDAFNLRGNYLRPITRERVETGLRHQGEVLMCVGGALLCVGGAPGRTDTRTRWCTDAGFFFDLFLIPLIFNNNIEY